MPTIITITFLFTYLIKARKSKHKMNKTNISCPQCNGHDFRESFVIFVNSYFLLMCIIMILDKSIWSLTGVLGVLIGINSVIELMKHAMLQQQNPKTTMLKCKSCKNKFFFNNGVIIGEVKKGD